MKRPWKKEYIPDVPCFFNPEHKLGIAGLSTKQNTPKERELQHYFKDYYKHQVTEHFDEWYDYEVSYDNAYTQGKHKGSIPDSQSMERIVEQQTPQSGSKSIRFYLESTWKNQYESESSHSLHKWKRKGDRLM